MTKELGKKFDFFTSWLLILIVFGFLPHTDCAVNKNKIEDRPKLKVGDGCL